MHIVLWVIEIWLAVLFAGAGAVNATQSLAGLREKLGGWVDDVPLPLIRVVGVLEVAAALGLVVPPLVDIAPQLTWVAAAGLVLTMIGAAAIHGRRAEWGAAGINVVLGLLAAVVVWGRLGPYAF